MTNSQASQDAAGGSLAPPPGCPAHGGATPDGATPLYGPRYRRRPMDIYRAMRRQHGPVAPVRLEGDLPAWLILGYREMYEVTSNTKLFERDARRWRHWDRVPQDWPLMPWVAYGPLLLFTEGEEHRKRAAAIVDAIAEVDQFELRSSCERFADSVIDSFAEAGEAELVSAYAYPVPGLTLVKLFGVSEDEADSLQQDMTLSVVSDDDANSAMGRAMAALGRLIKTKKERPGPDLTSYFLARSTDLTDEQLAGDLMAMMTAALPGVANWIGNTVRLMLTDSRFALTLSGGRHSVNEALNEVLWVDSPLQNLIGRYATRDTTLGGHRIRTGDMVILGLAAANTDPQLWPDPTAGFSGNNSYMTFSHGDYGCPVGAPQLAKTMAQAAVEVLLDRLPDVSLAVQPEELEWMDSIWYHGLTALPVTFEPTYVTGRDGD
ncbi:cytochrome P450 [Streptomyces odontomachi]|uniref:cytochrome P450 n=1 Tax=Streptomyces odontomachi TaxID=2944940 RepID=UPI00210E4615|nr:cytochrome P450 [Streptomyces sp. ODS25]